jgi:AcrR family transcriptional regulator
MPRTADPALPHRILKAADTLWQSGGEEAVTIRGVAAEAATTTPTVYSYYADREALLTALRALAFQRFSAYLAKSRDFQDACARHLEFGTSLDFHGTELT